MKSFNELRKTQRHLSKLSWGEGDKYFALLDSFKPRLRAFLSDSFLMDTLKRNDLIDFLDWCGKYRPVEPFAVLSHMSQMNERLKGSLRKNVARSKLRRQEREKRTTVENPTET